ncbi:ATP-binding cassette domain-containing protein [Asanoa siamensis]|uniref:Daunorubicin resistance protein DrrA family ABC transporter ATP-binding protein n=1 Tax=Asanoa siamensis TaxID=926357 RepID=A0ABQ4CNN5_9ACTN|nr:ATP-binding cassette domain-containing protein [Asanoa siamensis]GIF72913.1 daunorubicin resistance protein DrrA family ABC transporter ATP-binding protein [Asanoa siamensis]
MDAIRVHGIEKSYGKQRVLTGIDLTVPAGTVFGLLGPNGAGKTTLVRILATLVQPDAGRAEVAGHDVVSAAFSVREKISLTGQYAAVDELQTGYENLVMVGRLRRLGRAAAKRRATELLERIDLVDAGRKLVKTYSGGMRRRLDVAMSLVTEPPVIFLDEPTTGLDPRSRQQMWTFVRELADAGSTIFLTTQYLEEADQLADRIMLIDHGVAVADGTAAELKVRVGGERVELEFASLADRAAAVLDLGAAVTAFGELSLTVSTDGTAAEVRELLDRMDKIGATVAKVAIHRPTLDDVFFALTGGNPR